MKDQKLAGAVFQIPDNAGSDILGKRKLCDGNDCWFVLGLWQIKVGDAIRHATTN